MYKVLLFILSCLLFSNIVEANNNGMTKKERNFIVQGNEEFEQGNYANALKQYRNALTINPLSQVGGFNLASTLVSLSEKDYDKKEGNPIEEATNLFKKLSTSTSKTIAQKSLYNLGHLSYNQGDYASSIGYYKSVLRTNPDDDKARLYLRMAQLKQNEQNKQNQDNKSEEDEKSQEEKEQDEKKENSNEKQDQQPPQDSPEDINDANADRILKSIENKEKEILMRINNKQKNAQKTNRTASGQLIEKPW